MRDWLISLLPIAAIFDVMRHPEHLYAVAVMVDKIVR